MASQPPLEVKVTDFAAALTSGTAPFTVDVRPPAERTGSLGYIEGTVQVDLAQILDGSWDPPVDKTTPILFVCRSGNRSSKAALAVAARGYTTQNLTGGMLAWEAAGLPRVL